MPTSWIAEDRDLAGGDVDLDIRDVAGERCAVAAAVAGGVALDQATRVRELCGEILEREALAGRAAHAAVLVLHLTAVDLPDAGGALLQLRHDVVRGVEDRPAGGERGAAAAGDVREEIGRAHV